MSRLITELSGQAARSSVSVCVCVCVVSEAFSPHLPNVLHQAMALEGRWPKAKRSS